MNDDPYGNLLPSSSVLPLPLALLLFLLFFVLGALFAMCESAAETANESRIKKITLQIDKDADVSVLRAAFDKINIQK